MHQINNSLSIIWVCHFNHCNSNTLQVVFHYLTTLWNIQQGRITFSFLVKYKNYYFKLTITIINLLFLLKISYYYNNYLIYKFNILCDYFRQLLYLLYYHAIDLEMFQ
jgi:hypothetical protein